MKWIRRYKILPAVILGIMLVAGCGDGGGATQADGAAIPKEKEYTATGTAGADFPDAKSNAYGAVLELAIRELVGDSVVDGNYSTIESYFLSYIKGYKYIDDPDWVNRITDDDGNMVLTLTATVLLQDLMEDLGNLGFGSSSATTVNDSTSSTATVATTTTTQIDSASATTTTTTTTTSDADLSDLDVTALSFLVFCDLDDLTVHGDNDLEYADMAVSSLNSKLTALGVETYDPDAQELLVEERNLMQEATAGSVGVGLLLAEQVAAELYAEVTPTFTYSGQNAHVMLTVKVYSRTTGTLLLETTKGGPEMVGVNQAGAMKASLTAAVEKIMDELEPALADYISGGRSYFVRLMYVESYRDASSFSTAVNNVDGVLNTTLKTYSNDDMIADYTVKYDGNPLDLLDSIMMYLMDKSGFEYFDLQSVRGNELIFTMD